MTPISETITDPSVTTFTDTSVTEGTAYYYAMTAKDTLGNENKSVIGIGPIAPKNQTPVLDTIGNKIVNEGQLLEFTISATDAENDELAYSATNLPRGAYFSSLTKLFSFLPNYDQQGEYIVHFEVSDGVLSDSEDITITVNNVPVNPASGQTVGISLKVRVMP